MKYCPKCNKAYNINTKVCPLDHCPNCGSLELELQKSRRFKTQGFENLVTAGIMLAITGGLFSAMAAVSNIIYGLIGISLTSVVFVMVIFSQTISNFRCGTCKAKKFTPNNEIKLHYESKQKTEVSNTNLLDESEQNEISKKIDQFSHVQKEHHKRDLFLRIVGIVASVTIGLVGIFYSGILPDFIPGI